MKRIWPLTAFSIACCLVAQATQVLSATTTDDKDNSAASTNLTSPVGDHKIVHVLNRISFGPRPRDIENVRALGVDAYIDQQLNPQSLPESPAVEAVDATSETIHESNEDLLRIFRSVQSERNRNNAKQAQQELALKPGDQAGDKLGDKPGDKLGDKPANKQPPAAAPDSAPLAHPMSDYFNRAQKQFLLAKLTRATESPRQLEAVMTEFWFNHFNIFAGKEYDGILLGSYENEAIRGHALGKFKDLVSATCYHPAMLWYLDNSQNKASISVNENYARELMELHTLGVDGGYSQKDVIDLARVLTGLTIATQMRTSGLAQARGLQEIGKQGAYFDKRQHDTGDKVLLGHHISAAQDASEIEQALEILTKHPSTAHHICYQLAQYFIADDPPANLVDRLQTQFINSDGDIRSVLKVLFYSSEFRDAKYENNKFKTPLRYAVSLVRAVGGHIQKADRIGGFLTQQGQRTYGCLTPDGYKNTKLAWLDPDSILHRIEFALTVGSGKFPGVDMPPPDYHQLEVTLGVDTFSPNTIDVVDKAPKNLRAAAVLGSPELMRF